MPLALLALLKGVNWVRVATWLLIPLALWLAISGLWFGGEHHGEFLVQTKWDADKRAQALAIAELKGEITQKEAAHGQETAAISDQLRKTEATHDQTVAALRADLAGRLRASDQRALAYQRSAATGAAECGALASHTARLDRALEEGVGLVGELQAALGQREDQLRAAGAQLEADRKLVDGQ